MLSVSRDRKPNALLALGIIAAGILFSSSPTTELAHAVLIIVLILLLGIFVLCPLVEGARSHFLLNSCSALLPAQPVLSLITVILWWLAARPGFRPHPHGHHVQGNEPDLINVLVSGFGTTTQANGAKSTGEPAHLSRRRLLYS